MGLDYELHKQSLDYVRNILDHINPYEDPRLRDLYTVGFLSSFVAALIREDSRNLTMFKLAAAMKHSKRG